MTGQHSKILATAETAGEVAPVIIDADGASIGVGNGASVRIAATVTPTQVRRPKRAVIRTVFQAFVALCLMAPVLVQAAGLDPAKLPWLVGVLAVAAGVTRVMALPQVEGFLRRFVPWLAAAPRA